MSTEKASPSIVTGGTQGTYLSPVGRRLAEILLRYLSEVKDAIETRPFLERIMEDLDRPGQDGAIVFDSQAKAGERFGNPGPVIGKGNVPIYNEEGNSNEGDIVLDLGSSYLCDFCGHLWKGREIKILESGHLLCCWCEAAEVNYGIYRKERI